MTEPAIMPVKHCEGCRDDFYNGKNPMGVTECWMRKSARVVLRRRVGIDESPPWKRTPELLPNCYNADGFIFVGPKVER